MASMMTSSGPKPRLRSLARAVRHLPDRLLHARRRNSARRMLAGLGTPTRAVFICHGNINRSAYAAGAFTRALPAHARAHIRVSSMGFIGPGRSASELAQQVGGRRAVDLTNHRSRLLDAPELKETELIVVMSPRQRTDVLNLLKPASRDVLVLGDLDPERIDTRTIQDPYGHTEDVFERVFDRIDRCVDELVRSLRLE
jgi:protein-tyrosine phosphatase